jgi:DNA mismatch endonuclease, patch repair protein
MPDVVRPEVRSRMMSGIRGKNTKPELLLRSGLHRRGLRFRIHDKRLPGKPDIVFPGRHAVVFVHGCFWHGHEGCRFFKVPETRRDFWLEKIRGNQARDALAIEALESKGWRVAVVWECATRDPKVATVDIVEAWLRGEDEELEVAG